MAKSKISQVSVEARDYYPEQDRLQSFSEVKRHILLKRVCKYQREDVL